MAMKRKRPSAGMKKVFKKARRTLRAKARKSATVPRNRVTMGKGFPKQLTFTHRYVQNNTMVGTSGTIATQRFSCNGLYDPDVTGTGHQPIYFDQVSALYNHYVVIGSRIKATVMPATNSQAAFRCGFYIDDDGSGTANLTTLSELPTGKIRSIPMGDGGPYILTSKWSAKKAFGPSIMGKDSLVGTIAANPTEEQQYWFFLQAFDASSGPTVYVTFEVEYIAVWKELKQVGTS